jgi:nitrogen-specific signal transduction histidine kinase
MPLKWFKQSRVFTAMETKTLKPVSADFVDHFWEESWTYIKTVVDVVREPVLILDKELRVMAANESFYRTFQVELKDTAKKIVYELGNGQWNIPALRKLLEDILPKNTFFKGFEVIHEFPVIGRKVMILNARQIHVEKNGVFPPIILLAMEDITDMMSVAETLADHAKQLEAKLAERTQKLESHIGRLEKEINELKKKPA